MFPPSNCMATQLLPLIFLTKIINNGDLLYNYTEADTNFTSKLFMHVKAHTLTCIQNLVTMALSSYKFLIRYLWSIYGC